MFSNSLDTLYRMSHKRRNRFENSNGNCFIIIIKRLFLLKSAIIRINFDIFSSTFGDLIVKLEISKLQNYPRSKPELLHYQPGGGGNLTCLRYGVVPFFRVPFS